MFLSADIFLCVWVCVCMHVCEYIYIYIYIFIYIYNLSYLTVEKGDLKSPFSIFTTPRSWGRCYSFPWIAPCTLDPYSILLSFKQGGIKYYFGGFLVWLNLVLNPGLLGHWRTLWELCQWTGIYIYIYIYIYSFFRKKVSDNFCLKLDQSDEIL